MLGVEGGSTAGFLAGFSLETLVAPVDLTEFTNDHWDRAPLLVRRGLPDFYAGLTSISEIDAAVAAGSVQVSYIDARSGDGRTWVRNQSDPSQPASDTLLARMAEGATLIVDRAETTLAGLAHMCRLLMVETGHPWHCNLYATPPGGQGFDAHLDDTGVFILQISGSKEWSYGSTQLCRPIAGEHGTDAPHGWQDDAETARLNAGDLLYLPRGTPHSAKAGDGQGSLHITLTVAEFSWMQVATLDDASVSEKTRSATSGMRDLLPIGFHRDDAALCHMFEERFPGAGAARMEAFLLRQVRQFRCDLSGRFGMALDPVALQAHSKVLHREDLLWRITDQGDMRSVISGPICLAFPERAETFVRALLTRGGVIGGVFSDLTEDERIAVASSLLQHNLVRLA